MKQSLATGRHACSVCNDQRCQSVSQSPPAISCHFGTFGAKAGRSVGCWPGCSDSTSRLVQSAAAPSRPGWAYFKLFDLAPIGSDGVKGAKRAPKSAACTVADARRRKNSSAGGVGGLECGRRDPQLRFPGTGTKMGMGRHHTLAYVFADQAICVAMNLHVFSGFHPSDAFCFCKEVRSCIRWRPDFLPKLLPHSH